MTDRVLLGKAQDGDQGLWVSKPGANVIALVGNSYLESVGDWYGFQEEFDGDADGSYVTFISGIDIEVGSGAKIKTTANGTIVMSPDSSESYLQSINMTSSSKQFIGAEYPIFEIRLRLVDSGNGNNPDASSSARPDFIFDFVNKPMGETSVFDPATGLAGNVIQSWVQGTNAWDMSAANFDSTGYSGYDGTYTSIFNDNEYRILRWDMSNEDAWTNPQKYIIDNGGSAHPHPYTGQYRITNLYLQLNQNAHKDTGQQEDIWEIDYVRVVEKGIPRNIGKYGNVDDSLLFNSEWFTGVVHQTGNVTIGTAKALINGNTSSRVVGHNIDNDANGFVSFPELPFIPLVLFQRIDENVNITGASYPGGEDEFSVCASSWEDFRYPTIDTTTTESRYKGFDVQSFASGVTVSTDQNYLSEIPNFLSFSYLNEVDMTETTPAGTNENPDKQYLMLGVWAQTITEPEIDALLALYELYDPKGGLGKYQGMSSWNAYSPLSPYGIGVGWSSWRTSANITQGHWIAHYSSGPFGPAHSGYMSEWEHEQLHHWKIKSIYGSSPGHADISAATFPWSVEQEGIIPEPSARAGNNVFDMIESFSEVRTFAYARAKKDGFWLTCRNAIAQEGLEPALNLAPVLPEDGTANQGWTAFQNMCSNNDNGAWGMFHPALALYDVGDGSGPQKFTEGLQLTWDTRTTANSFLLDKVGMDADGVAFEQYKWHPSFSCSGLPFDGELARPTHRASLSAATHYPFSFVRAWTETGEGVYSGSSPEMYPDEDMQEGYSYALYSEPNPIGPQDWYDAQFNTPFANNGILRGTTGGFYPYRKQCHEWNHINGISHQFSEQTFVFLNTQGATVPNAGKFKDPGSFGFAAGDGLGTEWGNPLPSAALSRYYGKQFYDPITGDGILGGIYTGVQYNVKRISSRGIFHPQGVVPENSESFDNRNVPSSGTDIVNQTSYLGGSMNVKDTDAATPNAIFDKTKTKQPTYKYWVLRIPVSIPEYT